MGHVKTIAHLYGEHFATDNLYHNLKHYVLSFTTEQLSHDLLLQYTMAILHPRKWCGMSIPSCVALVQANQGVYVAPTDWTTANSMQAAVEDVVVLEYMWQIRSQRICILEGFIDLNACYGGKKSNMLYS
jgi:hypothetical protein